VKTAISQSQKCLKHRSNFDQLGSGKTAAADTSPIFKAVLKAPTVLACRVARGSEIQTAGAASENRRVAVASFGLISASLTTSSLERRQRAGTSGRISRKKNTLQLCCNVSSVRSEKEGTQIPQVCMYARMYTTLKVIFMPFTAKLGMGADLANTIKYWYVNLVNSMLKDLRSDNCLSSKAGPKLQILITLQASQNSSSVQNVINFH
jgi:hypothetical protein